MFFKILCLALLACTLIQAEDPKPADQPEGQWDFLNPFVWMKSGNDASHDLVGKLLDNFEVKMNSIGAAKKDIKAATRAKAETAVKLVLSLPRLFLKMFQQPANQTETNFFENLKKSFDEVLNENKESKEKAFNSSMVAINSVWNATAQSFNATQMNIQAFGQFASDLVEGVINRNDLSEAEKTEVKAAMKQIQALVNEESNRQAPQRHISDEVPEYKSNFVGSTYGGKNEKP